MPDVYLHIGLAKTGTSSIQAALEANRGTLAAAGVLFPGGRHHRQRLAAFDLLGQRVGGADGRQIPGAWDRLVAEVDAHAGNSVVISDEELSLARRRHVRRVLQDLRGHRVRVVVTVRDLGRTLVSAYQQSIVMGSPTGWRDFCSAVRQQDLRASRIGTGFWARQDLLRIVEVWGAGVPAEDVVLVTVPPRESPPRVLLDRFAAATGLPPSVWAQEADVVRNPSWGAAELESLRRLNTRVGAVITTQQHRRVIRDGLRHTEPAGSRTPRLPREELAWVLERSRRTVEELERRHHPVLGDLQDLLTPEHETTGSPPDVASDRELLVATEAILASLALEHARLSARLSGGRRRPSRSADAAPSRATLWSSSWRARELELAKTVLDRADESRAVSWAVGRYLRATTGRGRRR